MRAYDEMYLADAMNNLGEAVDYAVNFGNEDIDDFLTMFVTTGAADRFGKGVPRYVAGLTGTELAMDVITKVRDDSDLAKPDDDYARTPEFWCGWIIAFYQWFSGKPFKTIFEQIDGKRLLKLYSTLHEVSEEKCVEVLDKIMASEEKASRLQQIRENRGLSQRELSEKAEVNIRTLQQYEIKAKDINKAAASTLLALSRVLGCGMEDIMEV